MPQKAEKRLIVTGDDFGLSVPVNEAIERAHTAGVLTSASLMVAAPAAEDAIARARRLPSLRVGLHVVVARGPAMISPVPNNLFHAGVRYFFKRHALEAEIRAQFDAFARTGLTLDHVDAHHHMHCHQTVFATILRVGRDFGLHTIRIPREPFLPSWRASRSRFTARLAWTIFLWPWLTIMRMRARRAGIVTNDAIFGLNDTGAMTADRFVRIIEHLPRGTSEIYFHPTSTDSDNELAALTSPDARDALQHLGIELLVRSHSV